MNDETLEACRYYFQRILIPCVVTIGILGNFVNVIVLTRRRMRCSTNVYLTALAVSDIIFLIFAYIISLEHYPNWHSVKYELYWRTYGIQHWFVDAAAYTSIYLTVSFTIERYIVVCHPLRGQYYIKNSTKNAKRVISVVVILCFLSTITTSLEYQLSVETKYIDKSTHKLCENFSYVSAMQQQLVLPSSSSSSTSNQTSEFLISNKPIPDSSPMNISGHDIERSVNDVTTFDTNSDYVDTILTDGNQTTALSDNVTTLINVPYNNNENGVQLPCTTDVIEETTLHVVNSPLGENPTYKQVFFLFTSIVFVFLPLILLGTFNCFLVSAVRRSHKMRHKMTNSRITNDAMSAQENKITIILIAVVVLFLICQTPSAINLLYSAFAKDTKDKATENLHRALGNLWNFLITINAACNFILYCALSDKYRQTIKSFFKSRKLQRQNTVTSRFSRTATKRLTSSFHGGDNFVANQENFKRIPSIPANTKRPSQLPPSASKSSIMKIPRVSISQRPSLTPSDILNVNKTSSRKSSNASIQLRISTIGTPLNFNNSSNSHAKCLLQPSDSQTSLTRSQSLILPSSIKHAPDCKSHPDNVSGIGTNANSNKVAEKNDDEIVQNKNNINDISIENDKK
uniref:CSON009921 protein n=1 Tax=Culicoides sonorensis TaxID=179676 RepID=A0A336MD99_CULSO